MRPVLRRRTTQPAHHRLTPKLAVGLGDTRCPVALYEQIAAEDEPTDLESYRVQVAAVTNLAVAYCATGRAEDAVRVAHRVTTMAAARLPRNDPSRKESERFAEEVIANYGRMEDVDPGPFAPDA
jgi:hypothetical protein